MRYKCTKLSNIGQFLQQQKRCISTACRSKYQICGLLIFRENYNCIDLVHPLVFLFFLQKLKKVSASASKSKMNSAWCIVVNLIRDNFKALSTEYIFQNDHLLAFKRSKPKSLDFESKNLKRSCNYVPLRN